MWRRLRAGEVDVAIGARSALFAPVRTLGLLVVDEEHDPSFKQEEGVRYHARDMAIWRAHRAGGVCVLGSATPSLESEQLARTGRAIEAPPAGSRARRSRCPASSSSTCAASAPGPPATSASACPSTAPSRTRSRAREQVILFLNRRGFAPERAAARRAGTSPCARRARWRSRSTSAAEPSSAATTATSRRRSARGARSATPKRSSSRASAPRSSKRRSPRRSPTARVARLDRDVASGSNVEAILARVRAREIDILVGTQMVTKGHDLPNVTLVGVINADAALSIPDFRASERAFQLLVQVAGRAGRGDAPGRVLVQTWDPEHPAVSLAARHDVDAFLERELVDRRELGYPPLTRCALVRVDALDETEAREACARLAAVARQCERRPPGEVLVQGPAPAPIARVRSRWRFRVMLRAAARRRCAPCSPRSRRRVGPGARRPRRDRRRSGATAMTESRAMKARVGWDTVEGPSLTTRVETDRLVLRPPRTRTCRRCAAR